MLFRNKMKNLEEFEGSQRAELDLPHGIAAPAEVFQDRGCYLKTIPEFVGFYFQQIPEKFSNNLRFFGG